MEINLTSLKLNYCSDIIFVRSHSQIQRHQISPERRGFSVQPTRRPNSVNGGRVSGRGPTGAGQRYWRLKTKRQRQNHAHHCQQLTRAQFQTVDSRQKLDANQSNQIYVRLRTRIPRITYACTSALSGYIKRVEWRTDLLRLGLAKV